MTQTNKGGEKAGGTTAEKVAIGAAAIAAAALGGYFLFGTKKGKQARAHIKSWAFKAKGEVLEKLEALKDLSEVEYQAIVDAVAQKYQSLENVSASDVKDFVSDLKRQWSQVKKHITMAQKAMATKKPAPKAKAKAKKSA